jgi:hypothetical protein
MHPFPRREEQKTDKVKDIRLIYKIRFFPTSPERAANLVVNLGKDHRNTGYSQVQHHNSVKIREQALGWEPHEANQ